MGKAIAIFHNKLTKYKKTFNVCLKSKKNATILSFFTRKKNKKKTYEGERERERNLKKTHNFKATTLPIRL